MAVARLTERRPDNRKESSMQSHPSYRGSHMSNGFYRTGWFLLGFLIACCIANSLCFLAMTYVEHWGQAAINLGVAIMNGLQARFMIWPDVREEYLARQAEVTA